MEKSGWLIKGKRGGLGILWDEVDSQLGHYLVQMVYGNEEPACQNNQPIVFAWPADSFYRVKRINFEV